MLPIDFQDIGFPRSGSKEEEALAATAKANVAAGSWPDVGTSAKSFNPSQARDDHGRWTSDGGSPASVKPEYTGKTATEDILADIDKTGVTGADAASEFNDNHLDDTLDRFTDEDGKLDPTRAELHAKIIDSIVSGHATQDNPQALFTAGGSASGKSVLAGTSRHDDANLDVPEDAVMIDPDAIKKQLPEYDELQAAGRGDIAAPAVHEESSQIAKAATAYAYEHGQNVVLDGVGNSAPGKFEGKIQAAADAGDEVTVRYAAVPTEVAQERAVSRFQGTGRYVEPDVIAANHEAVSQRYVDDVLPMDDVNVEVYDTNATPGQRPPLIAAKPSGGRLTVYNAAKYNDFVSKGSKKAAKVAAPKKPHVPTATTLIELPIDSADYAYSGDMGITYPGPLRIDGTYWTPPSP